MRIITTTLYLLMEYMILYFAGYYLMGKGLQDLSVSPIWQWVFYKISFIGTLLYRATSKISKFIARILSRKKQKPVLASLVDIVLIALGLFILTVFASNAITSCARDLQIDIFEISRIDDAEGVISGVLGLIPILKCVFTSGRGFFGGIKLFFSVMIWYTILYIFWFSIIFGFLETRMVELHLFTTKVENGYDDEQQEEEESRYQLKNLPNRCVECMRDWIDDLAILNHLFVPKNLVAIIVLFGIYGVFLVSQNSGYLFVDIIELVLDESGIISSILSFLLVIACNMIIQFIVCYILPVIVPPLRIPLDRLSDNAVESIERSRQRRREWTDNHDSVVGRGGVNPLRFMRF